MVWWNAIAGFAQGYEGSKAFIAQGEANNRLSKVNADARNRVRQASNANEAAQNSLARWIQSVNNNRRLDAGGDALEQNIVNYRRSEDAALTQSFAKGISEAEQEGAMAAAAAVSGVDGNVVDMVNSSVALRDSIVGQQMSDFRDMRAYDTAARAGSIMSQVVGGMDNSLILDTLDYNIDVAQEQHIFSRMQYGLLGMIQHMGGVTGNPDKQQQNNRVVEGEQQGVQRARAQGDNRSESEIRADFKNGADNDQLPNEYRNKSAFSFSYDTSSDTSSLWSSNNMGYEYNRDDDHNRNRDYLYAR